MTAKPIEPDEGDYDDIDVDDDEAASDIDALWEAISRVAKKVNVDISDLVEEE